MKSKNTFNRNLSAALAALLTLSILALLVFC